jgi:hypothetical protein
MLKVCSSCGKDLGTVPGSDNSNEVSHGLCIPCSVHFIAEVGISLDEFIEGLEAPVVTVTENARIGTANSAAKQLMGKDLQVVSGEKPGDVFECEHALLPEGCGQTIHCSGCAIRQSISHTLKTGEACENVPAFLDHNDPEGERQIDILISTERKGGVVFLSVKPVN